MFLFTVHKNCTKKKKNGCQEDRREINAKQILKFNGWIEKNNNGK